MDLRLISGVLVLSFISFSVVSHLFGLVCYDLYLIVLVFFFLKYKIHVFLVSMDA